MFELLICSVSHFSRWCRWVKNHINLATKYSQCIFQKTVNEFYDSLQAHDQSLALTLDEILLIKIKITKVCS